MRTIPSTGIAASLYLVALVALAAVAADATQIPDSIRSQFGSDDTIIAMKTRVP